MYRIIDLPSNLKMEYTSLYTKEQPLYPILYKHAEFYNINNKVKNLILPYGANHIKWSPSLYYGGYHNDYGPLTLERDMFITKLKHNLIKRYDDSYEIKRFAENYKRIYKQLNKIEHGKFWCYNDHALSSLLHNEPYQALKYLEKHLSSFSLYFHTKYLEYLYKLWMIKLYGEKHPDRKYYITVSDLNSQIPNEIKINYNYKQRSKKEVYKKIKTDLNRLKTLSTLSGKIFTFVYKGMIIKVLPPIFNEAELEYDYKKSIYIKVGKEYKMVYSLPYTSKEYIKWSEWANDNDLIGKKQNKFKIDLFCFTNTVFTKDTGELYYTKTLLKHLISIEDPYKYMNYYTINYMKGDDKSKYVLKEFNEERAINKFISITKTFRGEILSIKKFEFKSKINKEIFIE